MANPFIDFDEVKKHADALLETLKPLQAAADEEVIVSKAATRDFFEAYAAYAEIVADIANALREIRMALKVM